MEVTMLFRPVGQEEYELVADSAFRRFPPRLPDQPIFYPVTNEEYAIQIARDWNTKSGRKVGYVLRFRVQTEYLSKFDVQTVGSRVHQEYWIPAEQLEDFNDAIAGEIEIIHVFRGA